MYNSMKKTKYLALARIQWMASLNPTRELCCVNLHQSYECWCRRIMYLCQEIILVELPV